MRGGFETTVEHLDGDAVSVALHGELDLDHAYDFDTKLRRLEAQHPRCLVLDLRQLTFLDSSGLARLLAARRRARKDQRRLVLVRGPAAVQRLFALTALDEQFEIVNDAAALSR
jgi:anti-sigma B factor antagonist